nr:hypothetical protein [Tanacetum cinerariifolium]
CRVFSSSLDGRPIRGKHVEEMIKSEAFYSFEEMILLAFVMCRVFSSSLDGRPIRGKHVEEMIKSEAFYSFKEMMLLAFVMYAYCSWILRRRPSLYATQATYEVDKKSYSIIGFAWAFKTWILESF